MVPRVIRMLIKAFTVTLKGGPWPSSHKKTKTPMYRVSQALEKHKFKKGCRVIVLVFKQWGAIPKHVSSVESEYPDVYDKMEEILKASRSGVGFDPARKITARMWGEKDGNVRRITNRLMCQLLRERYDIHCKESFVQYARLPSSLSSKNTGK